MNSRFLQRPTGLRRWLVLTLLSAWCLSHAAALTHAHEANSLQGHCTMCAAAALDDLVPTTSYATAIDTTLTVAPVVATPRIACVAPVRLYSPRAPPA